MYRNVQYGAYKITFQVMLKNICARHGHLPEPSTERHCSVYTRSGIRICAAKYIEVTAGKEEIWKSMWNLGNVSLRSPARD